MHPHHPSTSTGCSTVSASLRVSEEGRSRSLRPIAMESAALAFAKPLRLLQFQSRTSLHHSFRNYRDLSALMRGSLDIALVSTSTEAALRTSYDRGGSVSELVADL